MTITSGTLRERFVYFDIRPIYWIGTARNDVRDFPKEARRKAGLQYVITGGNGCSGISYTQG